MDMNFSQSDREKLRQIAAENSIPVADPDDDHALLVIAAMTLVLEGAKRAMAGEKRHGDSRHFEGLTPETAKALQAKVKGLNQAVKINESVRITKR